MKFLTRLTLILLMITAGCAGRNIHSDLKQDPKVLTRGWTYGSSTRIPEAGDRGFEYSSPTLYENTVIFGNQTQGLVSIYPGMQRVRWMFPVKGGVLGDILVEKKSLFFGGGDGFLYSISAETGKLIWKSEVKTSFTSRPTFSQNKLFVTSPDDVIRAFDAGTGKLLWNYKRRTPPAATIHAASTPLVDQGEVIAGMTDGYLVSLSVEDGSLKWEKKLGTSKKFNDIDASPVIAKDTIYVPAYDGFLYALKRKTGDLIWKFEAGGARQVLVEGESVYLPSSDGNVYAIAAANAKQLWKFEVDKGVPTSLVRGSKNFFVGSSHQYFYAIDAQTGKGTYRFNVGDGSGFSSAPLYDATSKAVYLLSMSGNLYQFFANEGEKKNDGFVFDVLNHR